MLRNFVAAVPREMEEAAAIDGAGPARIFWRILFPLVAPGLVATSVFSFIFAWNEYVFALTFLSPNTPAKFTLPIYVTYFMGQHSSDWGAIMAAVHPLHHPAHPVLPAGAATDGPRPGGRGGEGVSGTAFGAGSLTRLADAVLLPPFPGRPLRDGCCRRWKTVLRALRSSALTWPGPSSCRR